MPCAVGNMGLQIDSNKLVRAGTDGGDVCQRSYSVLLLCRLVWQSSSVVAPGVYENALQVTPGNVKALLNATPGILIRSTDGDWTSNPRTVSRDQMTPAICFNAVMANTPTAEMAKAWRGHLSQILKATFKRAMFAQNNCKADAGDPTSTKWQLPDFITPDLWSVFASGYMKTLWAPLAYPIMLLGDAYSVISTLITTLDKHPDHVDDTNINNIIVTRQYVWPTPFSWLARKIYKHFRKSNYGNLGKDGQPAMESTPVMGAIAWYNRNDNTDITELHRPLVGKY